MISHTLIPALRQQFTDRALRVEHSLRLRIVFPAAHPEVGDVIIWDDGSEATVEVGSMHGHFNPYNSQLSDAEVAEAVTEAVIDFLTSLFSDCVVLYRSPNQKHFGGWHVFDEPVRAIPAEYRGYQVYVWSGPLH